jgi:hypothetical protein
VSRETWEAAKNGDRIAVRYLPGAPHLNRAARDSGTNAGLVGIVLGTLFSAGGGGALFLAAYAWRRRRRLLERGVAARAVVLAVVPTRDKSRRSFLRYRFHDALGVEREGRSDAMASELAKSWAPGRIGEVRYDAANPDDHVWIGASA